MITIFQTLDSQNRDKDEVKKFWDIVENHFFMADIHFPIVLSSSSKKIYSFDEFIYHIIDFPKKIKRIELCVDYTNEPVMLKNLKSRDIFYNYHTDSKKYEKLSLNSITNSQANKKIWSLGSEGMPEINSHLVTLQQAVYMIDAAIHEDGFDEDELYIFTENLEPEDENPYSSLFFNVILDNEDNFKIKIKSNKEL